jgi:hypothetical protein
VGDEELAADAIQRVTPPSVAQGLLDPAADLVEGGVGQADGVEEIDDQLGAGEARAKPRA